MKHELNIAQPDYLIEDWPHKFEVFSWLEYVITIPNPIFLVTTIKENGKPNANLHSWGFPVGDRENYSMLLAIMRHTHTYANIIRTGEWCINYPSFKYYQACYETIQKNGVENDEITDAGFTIEPSQTVSAPRIAECFINLECRFEWSRTLVEGSSWQVVMGRVTHAAMDEEMMVPEPEERTRRMQLMYNMRCNIHPLTGEYYGPNTLAMLKEVVKKSPES
jgi:flavin reductase (DIM6/NTAB) family NADH-FMN oxidoreductase RutF